MKKSGIIKSLSIIIVVSSIIGFISCKKTTSDVDSETQSVIDNSICEQEFSQIQPTATSRAINTKGTGAVSKGVATASINPCDTLKLLSGDTAFVTGGVGHVNPTYEYDFSTCPNVNGDNITRTGKYNIRLTGPIKKTGAQMIIKLQNYKVNTTITYACDSMVITTLGTVFTNTTTGSVPVSYSFRIQVFNAVCTGGTGWTIKYSSDKTITVNTQGTATGTDDVIVISGTSNGTNRNGVTFDVSIHNITKAASCKFISSGTLDLTPHGYSVRTVDYGNGTCDDDATYTVNGQTVAFKMK